MARSRPCSDEMFVVAWQRATSVQQAAMLCGYVGKYAHHVARDRARRLRLKGVPLQEFRHRQPNTKKLAWLARKAMKESLAAIGKPADEAGK